VDIDEYQYMEYGLTMDVRYQMLAAARGAEFRRQAQARGLRSMVSTCREWVLGIIPVTRRCEETC
jgi:hypothetical protein